MGVSKAVKAVVRWYVDRQQTDELPFYCDAARIGAFAVEPDELAAGTEAAVFRLFVTLSMYQALRDVVIMRQQHSLPRESTRVVADIATVKRSISRHVCPKLRSVQTFEEGCDVAKEGGIVDCSSHPGLTCHVKDATLVFKRMGDMGKLPTSAWLRLWIDGGVRARMVEVCEEEPSPTKRAALLVERFAAVHRVGRKLATMFVSALSTPSLAPGLTPWSPDIDGNELVVVDTNVARAVDALRAADAPRTYEARARWVREQAALIDLSVFRPDLPAYSPRLVQEALYAFCSKSNRVAREDPCMQRAGPCALCTSALCPFIGGWTKSPRANECADLKIGASFSASSFADPPPTRRAP
ncbi:MAG: hypothetical protein IT381_32210 [Deltaproteobacteria bacterium]|nr:hypothetical protein [Deltaproteobacteria bacterium]